MRRATLTIRASIVLSLTLGVALATSCSKDEKEEPPQCDPAKQNCGTGGANDMPPQPIECGAEVCNPLILPFNFDPVAACCIEERGCGLDSSFLGEFGVSFSESCQARDQPGEIDAECPESAPLMRPELPVPIRFQGCCRVESGTCGYMLDKILANTVDVGLGCVDSTPFLEGGTATPCTPGSGGEGGGQN
ncbi:MAG TPA: hypothetical protein VGK73_02610 [Polyangiaceae bacterium]